VLDTGEGDPAVRELLPSELLPAAEETLLSSTAVEPGSYAPMRVGA
jgi:hypothetical protein